MMLLSPQSLHIPDGFLSTPVALVGWGVAIILLALALRRTRGQLGERQIPTMGLLAAFIFAAQAINFPIAGGSSGHILGGALAAILLGPWSAVLVMTTVVGTQALLFQDGGLLAMGWNIVNLGVLSSLGGWATHTLLRRDGAGRARRMPVAAFLAGWISVMLGASATSLQLAVSGTASLLLVLPAMLGVHALIGVVEGLVTAAAVRYVWFARPALLGDGRAAGSRLGAGAVLLGIGAALVVALLAPLASALPDGLEFVAAGQGFLDRALDPLYELLPNYSVPFVPDQSWGNVLAVSIGVLVVFLLALQVGRRAAQSPPQKE